MPWPSVGCGKAAAEVTLMAELATLDADTEAALREVERETGAWLVAYAPSPAGGLEDTPGFVERLEPAQMDEHALVQLRDLERRTGCRIVAYTPVETTAR